jgi:hypothetical protein
MMLAPEIFANSIDQFFSSELSLRFYNCSLAVHPMWFYRIQPRTLDRQSQGEYSHPAFLFRFLVVLLDPDSYFLALMPSSIVPDKRQHLLAFSSQILADYLKEISCHLAHGPSIYKSQHQLVSVASEQPVTAQCLRVQISLALFDLMKLQPPCVSPGMELRLMKPAPPRLIFITQNPITVRSRKPFQPFKLLFFKAYCGSGLVIHLLARFHLIPRREIALRIISRLTGLPLIPCSDMTSAANSKVQREVGLPNWRGEECSNARNFSHLAESRTGLTVFGRRDFSSREAKALVWKSRITLRQVCVAHTRERAILDTRSPRELASSIWQRRTVNALRERKPASICFRSSVVKDRTNIGGFMPAIIS